MCSKKHKLKQKYKPDRFYFCTVQQITSPEKIDSPGFIIALVVSFTVTIIVFVCMNIEAFKKNKNY